MEAVRHKTVLLRETLAALSPRSGGVYADATLGDGGHAEAILEASAPDGKLIGIDRDKTALDVAKTRLARFGSRATLVHGTFSGIQHVLHTVGVKHVHGLVADLGVRSEQLDDAHRGFSFSHEGPLDMRMDASQGETAHQLLSRSSEKELADIFFHYGEERRARAAARGVRRAFDQGEIHTTSDLARVVMKSIGPRRVGRIHPATRVFQAVRIALNRELDELRELVSALPDVLEVGGVGAVISFHSLEDRIVKHSIRNEPRLAPLTKRPVIPTEEECRSNPRARSAKLRAAQRVAGRLAA